MNKKLDICALALALLLLAPLAGCGGTSDKGEPAGPTGQTSAAPVPNLPEASAPPEGSAAEDEVIHASTAGELLEAIAPGAVIELAPGTYNLTEYLRKADSDAVSDYVARGFTDGWQAEIRAVKGLTIRAAEGGEAEVVAEPRYSDVLYFSGCSDIAIKNITFGHTIERGNCQGAVLAFDDCQKISLDGLDLYGCGTYGIAADHTVGITVKNCTIRECSYGIVDLSSCGEAVFESCAFRDNRGFDMLSLSGSFAHFEDCAFTGNEGDSLLPLHHSSNDDENGVRFARCGFGRWESQSIKDDPKTSGSFAFDENCRFEGYSWSDITESSGGFERVALDTKRLKVASFDAEVLTAHEYFILYETVDGKSGEVSFETSEDVRFLTFEEDGRGCFWTDNEKGRPFRYEMDSAYSCQVFFDDGGKASFGLYADQGGALPRISEEGSVWLALYLEDAVLWCY